MDRLNQFSNVTLSLYQAIGSVTPEDVRSHLLEATQKLIPFDSALWAQAVLAEELLVTHNLYLHNQPTSMRDDYAHWSNDDSIFEKVICNPGHCLLWSELEDPEERHQTEMYQQYADKYGLEDGLSIMHPHSGTGVHTFLSLYRNKHSDPFTESERDLFQALSLHLVQAENIALIQTLRQSHNISSLNESVAVINAEGLIKLAEADFIDSVHAGWPGWQPPRVPEEIYKGSLRKGSDSHTVNGFLVRTYQTELDTVVMMRTAHPVDQLTPRQRRTAELLAEGLANKEVANRLQISASTVTNRANVIFQILGISKRAEIYQALAGQKAEWRCNS